MGLTERRETCRELIDRYYAGVPTREDVTDRTLAEVLLPSHVLLDAGCGSQLPLLARYGARASLAFGVDLCRPDVTVNGRSPVVLGNLEALPLRSASVDIIVSRSVLEHLDYPVKVFQEFGRVLRPRGKLVFTTPNKYYYSCLVARLTPEWVKRRYFRAVFGEDVYDYFPVRYRANTLRAFRRLARAGGLEFRRAEAIRHYPFYFVFSPTLFRLGIVYDRIITRLRLDRLQSNWLVVMEKP